jgi:hypothetical protein
VPGRYTLYARNHSTGEHKDLSLRIKRSSRFELETGDDAASSVGLVLGIGGSFSLGIGLIALAAGLGSSTDDGRSAETVGLGLLLAGAVATPVGWSMYASNRTHLTRIDRSSYSRTEIASRAQLGVVGVIGGLGLGGLVTF